MHRHSLYCSAATAAFRVHKSVTGASLACFLMLVTRVGLLLRVVEEGVSFTDPVVVSAVQRSRTRSSTYEQEALPPQGEKRQHECLSADAPETIRKKGMNKPFSQLAPDHAQRKSESRTKAVLSDVVVANHRLKASNLDLPQHLSPSAASLCQNSVASGVKRQGRNGAESGESASNPSQTVSTSSRPSSSEPTKISFFENGTTRTVLTRALSGKRRVYKNEHVISPSVARESFTSAVNDMPQRSGVSAAPLLLRGTVVRTATPVQKSLEMHQPELPRNFPKSASRAAATERHLGNLLVAYTSSRHVETSQRPTQAKAEKSDVPLVLLEVMDQSQTNKTSKASSNNAAKGDSNTAESLLDEYCLQICRARHRGKVSAKGFRSGFETGADTRVSLVDTGQRSAKNVSTETARSSAPANNTTTKTTTASTSDNEVSANEPAEKEWQRRRLSRRHTLSGRKSPVWVGGGLQRANSLTSATPTLSRRLGKQSQHSDRLRASLRRTGPDKQGQGEKANESRSSQDLEWNDLDEEIFSKCDCLPVEDGDYRVHTLSDGWGSLTLLVIAGFVACVAFFVAVLLIAWHITMQPTPPTLLVDTDSAADEERRRTLEARHAVALMSSGRWQSSLVETADGVPFHPTPSSRCTAVYTAPTRVYYTVENRGTPNTQCYPPEERTMERHPHYIVRHPPRVIPKSEIADLKSSSAREPQASKRSGSSAEPSKALLREKL